MASHYVSHAVVISNLLLSITILAGARLLPSGHSGDKADVVTPHDDATGTCATVIIPQGYNCQEFRVQTQDGFVLGLQNIPNGRNAPVGGAPRTPVLLQHGVTGDGVTWLVNSPQQSLAYILADNGYDVWIANGRGTRMSRDHVSLSPYNAAYWDWSWDEIVAYDLPAMVDFIYQRTGQKLNYVGHSQGTQTVMASLSLPKGGVVDKLRSAALLCPVAHLTHIARGIDTMFARGFRNLGLPGVSNLAEDSNFTGVPGIPGVSIPPGVPSPPEVSSRSDLPKSLLGMPSLPRLPEFNPTAPYVSAFINFFCNIPGFNCYDIMSMITGMNCCLDPSTVAFFLQYEPQPTSMKNMIHLSQQTTQEKILKYNYILPTENFRKYGQPLPPEYNLQAIPTDFPLFVSYGGRDTLSDFVDVQQLLNNELKQHNVTTKYVEYYAHLDFIMAVNAKENVYDPLLAFFSRL